MRIFLIVVILAFSAIVFLLLDARQSCADSGGIYVRTMFGYECIGEKP